MQKIYQEIEKIEQGYANGHCDLDELRIYHRMCMLVREQKRFFTTLIKYRLYAYEESKLKFFNFCCFYGQKAIYDRYMPNYFADAIVTLANQNTPYQDWQQAINKWYNLIMYAQYPPSQQKQLNMMGLHFVATIMTLKHDTNKQHLLDNILNHPIYKKMFDIFQIFLKTRDMQYIDKIHEIGFKHMIKVRKSNHFDDDPWLNFYNDFQNDQEYKDFIKPYYQYMDNHNITYQDKLIIFLYGSNNIGDYYAFAHQFIDWSQKNNVPLIVFATSYQAKLLKSYFNDYFDAIITHYEELEDKDIPVAMRFLYPTPNRFVCVRTFHSLPPYYIPCSMKRHFNHFTHDELYKTDAYYGDLVPICPIANNIKQKNQDFFKEKNLNPRNVILLSPTSQTTEVYAKGDFILKDGADLDNYVKYFLTHCFNCFFCDLKSL